MWLIGNKIFYGKKAKIIQILNGLHEFDVLRDHDFSEGNVD